MGGIAGIIELTARRPVPPDTVARMAAAIAHRGPDGEGFLFEPGLGFANRRLAIVGLADGEQPIFNEDRTVAVVFNGELYDFAEQRTALEDRGHRFATACDTELLVHMWEEHGIDMLARLRGQFAFALYDYNERRVVLARDRLGMAPLHWARRGNRLYFGSEVKAILASGEVESEPDPRGIDNIFTFFAMPGRRTCFRDISQILPGTCLDIRPGDGTAANIVERHYWDFDFPDKGDEYDPGRDSLVEEFGATLDRAVRLRLRGDVPVAGYLSGGVDSATIVATATRLQGHPPPTFSIDVPDPKLNEIDRARLVADRLGSQMTVVPGDPGTITDLYPALVGACNAPVTVTSCAALHNLARSVSDQGYKVALTGEGADEVLAGYSWLKINRLVGALDVGRFRPSNLGRWLVGKLIDPGDIGWRNVTRYQRLIGGPHGISDLHAVLNATRNCFYSADMMDRLGDYSPFENLVLDTERMQRWHPLNRALYFGLKTMLPGLLLNQKGDRPAMASGVETRYPFLDEEVIDLCARIHPRWKLKGLFADKRILREYASSFLPDAVTRRPKELFSAPLPATFFADSPPFVDQLLSPEALERTALFDPHQVRKYRDGYLTYRFPPGRRLFVEMGLTSVMATQLWFHIFIHGDLCDLPAWSPPDVPSDVHGRANNTA